jgi:uncharacterized protein YndB with AHSA1/START domain
MKIFTRIVIVVGVLIIVLFVVALCLPSTFSVQRSAVIGGDPNAVYTRFETPRTWAEWSEWTTRKDPTLHYVYEGPESGPGATMRWTSKQMGDGHLTIVEAVPVDHVRYELRMVGSDMEVHGHVQFAPTPGGTRVTWHDTGSLGSNPLYRLMTPMMDRMLGGAFEESLNNLKRIAAAA